jgi:hypothetical protein
MKEKITKIERYLNPVAQMHLDAEQTYKVLIAGRGFSKSFTNGLKQAKKLALMPRSCGLFGSPTYSMIYTKTLIPMVAAWDQHMGYIEGIHYVIGKAPPKHFEKPYHKPRRYENVVSWWNGRTIMFASFDRPELISGGSYDDADMDEAYMIEKGEYDDYVIPTLRGTHPSFKRVSIHRQQSFTSSMPYRNQGDWLLEFLQKGKLNPSSYHFIGWDPDPNVKVQLGSTYMNHKVLGKKAIDDMKLEMDINSFRVMIKNEQVTNFGNTFYPNLSKKHFYTPVANEKLISVPINQLAGLKRDASYDIGNDDYNPDKPIHISHDWGKFNCITIDQEYAKEIRFINAMHVFNGGENPKDLDDLADMFAEYYRMHKAKIIYQWGDKSGNNTVANSKKNHFEQFADRIRSKDSAWRIIMKKTGDIPHIERHRFINKLYKEDDVRLPRIRHNATHCSNLRIALESTPMKNDDKDKSSERNDSVKQEHATHYTDAYDYRLYHALIHKEKDKYAGIDPHVTSL